MFKMRNGKVYDFAIQMKFYGKDENILFILMFVLGNRKTKKKSLCS